MNAARRAALASSMIALAACNVVPERRSLKDEPSSFREQVNAPSSRWQPAGTADGQTTGGPESTFGEAGMQASVFREAEIPPERLARTTELLSSLNARETTDHSIVVTMPADVLFDFDKADLRPDARKALADAAELLAGYPTAPIEVAGHTDAKGTDAYNDPLSRRRAQAVATWLKAAINRDVQATGFGKRRPVAPNTRPDGTDDPDGRQRNRRVEIVIKPARVTG